MRNTITTMARRIWSRIWTFDASLLDIGVSMIMGGALVGMLWKQYHMLKQKEREDNYSLQNHDRWDINEIDEIRKARDKLGHRD